jgi:hypothetical protein
MPLSTCLKEFRNEWLPHVTEVGLNRVIELLEQGSPLLIHGAFTRAVPQGCLATHIAWHHPRTCELTQDAGITWLSRIAGLNPATSLVISAWDVQGWQDWELRTALLEACRDERSRRASEKSGAETSQTRRGADPTTARLPRESGFAVAPAPR